DALVEDPALHQSLVHRLRDAAVTAHQVDDLQMIAMPALDAHAPLQVHAERRPEEALLEVVDGEPVTAEERLDVALADQASQVGAPPPPRRPGSPPPPARGGAAPPTRPAPPPPPPAARWTRPRP